VSTLGLTQNVRSFIPIRRLLGKSRWQSALYGGLAHWQYEVLGSTRECGGSVKSAWIAERRQPAVVGTSQKKLSPETSSGRPSPRSGRTGFENNGSVIRHPVLKIYL